MQSDQNAVRNALQSTPQPTTSLHSLLLFKYFALWRYVCRVNEFFKCTDMKENCAECVEQEEVKYNSKEGFFEV
jgi:hypothetical protein